MNTNVNIDNNINKGINSLNEKKKKKRQLETNVQIRLPTPFCFHVS